MDQNIQRSINAQASRPLSARSTSGTDLLTVTGSDAQPMFDLIGKSLDVFFSDDLQVVIPAVRKPNRHFAS
jgi:hypothetical protein